VDKLEEIDLSKPVRKKNNGKNGSKPTKDQPEEQEPVQRVEAEPDWSDLPPEELEYDAPSMAVVEPTPKRLSVHDREPEWGASVDTIPDISTGKNEAFLSIDNNKHGDKPAEPTPPDNEKPGIAEMPEDYIPQQITVSLVPTGDKARDKARLIRVHTILTANPGKDRFRLLLFENGKEFELDFPNQTTHVCDEVLTTLKLVVGAENIHVAETIVVGGP
jgi:hypothetical protein